MNEVIIGVDVGGTNTDAVARAPDGRVLAVVELPTTDQVIDGVQEALTLLVKTLTAQHRWVRAVTVGTTHFTNALATEQGLSPVACLRLGRPFTIGVPPFADWPDSMVAAVHGHGIIVTGGCDYDGTPYAPLNPTEVRAAAREMAERGVRGVAISSPFSPVNAEIEQEAAAIVAEELGPGVRVTLSCELGTLELLPRENAALLNAALSGLADATIDGFAGAVRAAGLDEPPLWFSQNDGTVMDAESARRFPVRAISAGPTNSMRGAALLSGATDCAVVDVGGTTSDVSILRNGFVRPAGQTLRLGGVLTNFQMPEVVPVPLGGGSRVRVGDEVTAGPDSVGRRLTSEALIFGGDTLTTSDLAVAGGYADFGDPSLVADLDPSWINDGLSWATELIAHTIHRMSPPVPVVLVGGGAPIIGDLSGLGVPLRPEYGAHANAIGAAAAQIGGTVDRVVDASVRRRDYVLAEVREEAAARAVELGAHPDTLRVVTEEVLELHYLPGDEVRVRATVVGDLYPAPNSSGRMGGVVRCGV